MKKSRFPWIFLAVVIWISLAAPSQADPLLDACMNYEQAMQRATTADDLQPYITDASYQMLKAEPPEKVSLLLDAFRKMQSLNEGATSGSHFSR